MKAALVIALTCTLAYMIVAGCAPSLASDLGLAYGAVVLAAWIVAVVAHERRGQ